MKTVRFLSGAMLCLTVSCFSPSTVTPRHFNLASVTSNGTEKGRVRIGIGVVKMPDYLMAASIAVRKNAWEITYLENDLWAERLDYGFARVLAANLSAMLPTDQVRTGAWRTGDVTLEVHISVDRFDVDQAGNGNLVAWWQITDPGGKKILTSGVARLSKTGKSPANDPESIVKTMSDILESFSETLTNAVHKCTIEF